MCDVYQECYSKKYIKERLATLLRNLSTNFFFFKEPSHEHKGESKDYQSIVLP
jgi:hypothetical protein